MRLVTMHPLSFIRAAAVLVALTLPQRTHAQTTETAVPVGGAVVGMGPNGATLRCKDGFYPAPGAADSACQDRGGVLARFPIRRTPSRAADARATSRSESAQRRAAATATVRTDSTRPPGFEPYAVRRARADSLNRAANTRPPGATLLCTDGTWIVRDTTQSRCASHGGVSVIVPPTQ